MAAESTAAGAWAMPLVAVDRVLRLDDSGITIEKALDADEYFILECS
jgi:hypothetical protein